MLQAIWPELVNEYDQIPVWDDERDADTRAGHLRTKWQCKILPAQWVCRPELVWWQNQSKILADFYIHPFYANALRSNLFIGLWFKPDKLLKSIRFVWKSQSINSSNLHKTFLCKYQITAQWLIHWTDCKQGYDACAVSTLMTELSLLVNFNFQVIYKLALATFL